MKESRRCQIEELVAARKSVSMQELCEHLNVSMNTIRTDVNTLVKEGVIEKVYGGVVLKEQEDIPLYDRRSQQQTDSKCRIAKAAESTIVDDDIVYIDAGTTTVRLLDYLNPQKHITIVTASVSALIRAQTMPNVTIMMLPGLYDKRTNSFLDNSTVEYLTRFRHTKAFLGVSALTSDGGLGVSNWQEYELKRAAIVHSQKTFLLVDATKYGKTGLLCYGSIEQMEGIFTDVNMPEAFSELCKGKNVQLYKV